MTVWIVLHGKTEAVLTLTEPDVRPVDQNDLIAVRPLSHTAKAEADLNWLKDIESSEGSYISEVYTTTNVN